MNGHDEMLDSVAVYALGAMPPAEAAAVREHLATCEQCRAEYEALTPAVTALGVSSTGPAPSPLLKRRIMRAVKPVNVAEMRAVRPIVWPAYAVAAACLAVAIITTIFNISLNEEMHQSQAQVATMNAHTAMMSRQLARQRTMVADLVAPDARRYRVNDGTVIRRGNRIYLAMQALPPPPKGKVYQAWTLHAGAKKMSPSVTFVPNRHGIAVVPIPAPASNMAAIALSVEPEGGSRQPTSTPTFVLKFG